MGKIEEGKGLDSSRLDKGMRLAFGLASQDEEESVLDTLERVTGSRAAVSLPAPGVERDPILRIPGKGERDDIQEDARYQVVGEIARGGVGVIYQGRDRDLGRDVAIKVLRRDRLGSPEVVQRFIEEAQIEGQLQHPGVVPVYGLGVQPDGRPYFAMKLVKGDTLASMLAARRKLKENRSRLLQVFEQVCQTVAYAHARHVIHRDLKPANILVGAYGQVQVVDWGFAKVLTQGGIADEAREPRHAADVSLIETVRSSKEGSKSIAGSVMGTPAYMPPEQAHGLVSKVDETSDVFALGGILAEILTGKPPYAGSTATEVMRQAIKGDTTPARARLKRCDADRELTSLAKRCLAPAQAARPRNASEVADAVHAYLASIEERAHKAELEAAKARVREEGERHAKRLTLGLAAAVLLGVLGVGGLMWRADRSERDRLARATQAVGSALGEVSLALGRAQEAGASRLEVWPDAVESAEQAVMLAEKMEAPDEMRTRALALRDAAVEEYASAQELAEQLANEEAMLTKLRDAREYRWVPRAVNGSAAVWAKEAQRYADAFREGGVDWNRPRTAAARVQASPHRDELIYALDAWCRFLRVCELDPGTVEGYLRITDTDPLRARIRAAEGRKDADDLLELMREQSLRELPTLTIATLSHALGYAGDRVAAREAAEAWHAIEPEDSDACFTLGLRILSQSPLTETHYREAAIPLTQAVSKRTRGLAARCLLATALSGSHRLDDAVAAIDDALDLAPEERGLRVRLGGLLMQRAQNYVKGELHQSAYEEQKKAVQEWEQAEPEGVEAAFSRMYHYLAVYAQKLGRWPEVLQAAERAVSLHSPAAPVTIETLALAQVARGKLDQAERTLKLLDEQDHVCAQALTIRATIAASRGHLDEALQHMQEVDRLPLEHGDLPDVNLAWFKRAEARLLDTLGRYDDALDELEECRRLDPDNAGFELARARVLLHDGQEGRARRAAEAAANLQLRHLRELPPGTAEYYNAAYTWGTYVGQLEGLREAERRFRSAFRGAQQGLQGLYLAGVGDTLRTSQAREQEAMRVFQKARELFPRCALAWRGLAQGRYLAGDEPGAVQAMERAVECQGSLDPFAAPLASMYLSVGRADEIEARLEDSLWADWLLEAYRPAMEAARIVDGYLRGHRHPRREERMYLAEALVIRGQYRSALKLVEGELADGPRPGLDEREVASWRYTACWSAVRATAGLAGDLSLGTKERSRWRREAAEWVRKLARALEDRDRFLSLYAGDPRPGLYSILLTDSRLAPIRDEEAMASASEEDKQLCREAWAQLRGCYDRVR